jgi:hypothetical protein
MSLYQTDGHVLMFGDEGLATFYDSKVAEAVSEALNYPHSEASTRLNNLMWDKTNHEQPLIPPRPSLEELCGTDAGSPDTGSTNLDFLSRESDG